MTMVARKVLVENGRVLTLDEESIKKEVRDLMPFYRNEIKKTHLATRRLELYYREMYLKFAATDVGMNRWVGEEWNRQAKQGHA